MVTVSKQSFITVCLLASGGILIAMCILIFNVHYRNKRIIKMSSPNLNNIILLGCIVTYCTVFFDSNNTQTFCVARIYVFTVGFAMVFGTLFSKTWRIHLVFANVQMKKKKILDRQLIMSVIVLVLVDLAVLVAWTIYDPIQSLVITVSKEASENDPDVIIQSQILTCVSHKGVYFKWALYAIQGSLLVFGAFLAWETRKVKYEALNDSRLIGMCIYNVLILSGLTYVVSLVVIHEVETTFLLTSGTIILGTTLTQGIIFIPKIMNIVSVRTQTDPTSGSARATVQSSNTPITQLEQLPSTSMTPTPSDPVLLKLSKVSSILSTTTSKCQKTSTANEDLGTK